MSNLGGNINRVLATIERIHVVGEGFPVPRQSFSQGGARNIFDTFQHADEPGVLLGGRSGRGETDTTVTHHD